MPRTLLNCLAIAAAALALVAITASPASATGPGDGWQRFRFPWVDGTSYTVTWSVGSGTHTGGQYYFVDFSLPYYTFVGASGQGDIVGYSVSYTSKTGWGAYVIQAASTAEPSPSTRYILYAHLCYTAATSGTLYQGAYVGRSGNSGYTLGSDGTEADPRCSSGDLRGMHIHFGMSKSSGFSSGNEYQFGAITDTQVSTHVASTSSLPVSHSTLSNNAGGGYYSYNGANGSSPTVDSWIAATYNSASYGLNFGSTSVLDANYRPCTGSTVRWVHGCVWGSYQGIVQTFKSPAGESRALTRESGYTSVFKVEGPVLYAWNKNASVLGYATTNRSGTTQTFRGGSVVVTSCQTVVKNASGVTIATYSGIC